MAPPKRPWFRFYVEAVADKKLRRQKPETRWLFVACLAAARQSAEPGVLLVALNLPMNASDLADFAGLTVKQVEAGMAKLIEVGIVAFDEDSGAWFVPAWSDRQYESDLSTDRVRRSRDATTMERPNTVSGTSAENRGQRTEAEREDTPSRGHHALLRKGAAPSLLDEADQTITDLNAAYTRTRVDAAVAMLVGDKRRFQWPSTMRAALAALLDSTGHVDEPRRRQLEEGAERVRLLMSDPAVPDKPEDRGAVLARTRAARRQESA